MIYLVREAVQKPNTDGSFLIAFFRIVMDKGMSLCLATP